MSKIESAGEWFDRVLPEEFDPSKVGGFSGNMKSENFMSLMNGEINGQQAFMSGKLKFKGNMSKAMKLQELLF